MTIKRRRAEGLTLATPQALAPDPLNLGAKYGRIVAIRCKGWASAAKAGASVDTAFRVRVTDNNADVVYLDAADRDYSAAEITLNPSQDDTATGLDVTPVDATGATATAGAGAGIIAESPVTVAIVNGGTATDFVTVDLFVEV